MGCHFLPKGLFPTRGLNASLPLAGGFFTTSATWESWYSEAKKYHTQRAGARPHRRWPRATAAAIRSQRQGWRRGSPLPQGLSWPVGDLGEGAGDLQDTAPTCSLGPPAYPLAWGPVHWKERWRAGEAGRRPESVSYTPEIHSSANLWLKGPTKGCSLTLGRLGEGPATEPTNGWAGPLMVVPQPLPGNGVGGRGEMAHSNNNVLMTAPGPRSMTVWKLSFYYLWSTCLG